MASEESTMIRLDLQTKFLVVARKVQAVVVVFGVVGLRRVDYDQAGSPEMSSVACSSEMKEDGLRFVLRVSEELYLNIY